MLSMSQKLMVAIFITGSLFFIMGCDQEGPAERAGEKVDESVQQAGENIQDAGDKIQDAAN